MTKSNDFDRLPIITMDDPLKKFLIDSSSIEKEKLALLLEPYFHGVDGKTNKLYFKPIFNSLDVKSKVICYLLGARVANLNSVRAEKSASPKEIEDELKLPGGTVRRTLMELKSQLIVDQESGGSNYFIPSHVISTLESINNSQKGDLNHNRGERRYRKSIKRGSGKDKAKVEQIQELNIDRTKWEPYHSALTSKGNYLERSLLIIKLAKDSGVDGITPKQIEYFLLHVLRTPISSKNISYVLGKTPASITDRILVGQGYLYKIMKAGEDRVDKYVKSFSVNGGVPESGNGTALAG